MLAEILDPVTPPEQPHLDGSGIPPITEILTGGFGIKAYLAGPMRGYPEFNFPAFREARTWLRSQGHEILCPAERDEGTGFDSTASHATDEHGTPVGFDIYAAMKDDIYFATQLADAIILLPGYEESTGAKVELLNAVITGKRVFEYLLHFPGRLKEITGTVKVDTKVVPA